jgi:uncharacterized protein YndB with AHSA1/START domain
MQGTLRTTHDGRYALRFERVFGHPCAKVWRAITEPDQLRSWEFPAVVDLTQAAGTKVTFASPEDRFPALEGMIVVTEPPTLLEYTWGDEILRWELEDLGDGRCRLVFTNIFDDRDAAVPAAAGWHAAFEVLEARLDGRAVNWSAFDRADVLHDAYARNLG